MLNELLVLGLIPGTNLQITFSEMLILVEIVMVAFLFRIHHLNRRSLTAKLTYFTHHWRIYAFVKKGTQLNLPV
ncbi:MAG TPA: hypothetical protein VFP32_03380 [Candidatus Saccharimonadales bacterium]|nr:hypothetical protein [Candidatus Saccharimonadales bacterium]